MQPDQSTAAAARATSELMLEPLRGRRILLYATGCVGAMFLPNWVHWCRAAMPDMDLKVVTTPSAQRFFAKDSLRAFAGMDPLIDGWSDKSPIDMHIDLAEWPDAYLVHPASINFVSRLALGFCDTPLMLALQGTRKPIVVAASTPPHFSESDVWARHRDSLAERSNVLLIPPLEGESALRPGQSGSPAVYFTDALARLAAQLEPVAQEVVA